MDKIWEEGFTKFDLQIIADLQEIQSELIIFFEKEGRVVFDWSGELIEHSFDSWQNTSEEIAEYQRIKKIIKDNLDKNPMEDGMKFDEHFDFDDFLSSVKDLTKESKKSIFGDLELIDLEKFGLDFKKMKESRQKSLMESNPRNLSFYHCLKSFSNISQESLGAAIGECLTTFDILDVKSDEIVEDVLMKNLLHVFFPLLGVENEERAEAIAEIFFVDKFYSKIKDEFSNLIESISEFKKDFLSFPIEYIGGHNTDNRSPFYFLPRLFSIDKITHVEQAEKYLNLD